MSGGSPEAERPRGYDRVEVLIACAWNRRARGPPCAAVSMSGGSPKAGRWRGYDRVKALAADHARLEEENVALHARRSERQLAGGQARATAWLRPGQGARCRLLTPEAKNETLHAHLL
ncbi:hypothetical protein ACQJBY_001253 [Aegilops geniculata]